MSEAPDEYSVSYLRKTKWGDVRKLEDGSWETTWSLTLKQADAQVCESVVLSDPRIGFESHLAVVSPQDVRLVVITSEHAMSAVNYQPTYSSLRIVNDDIAEIESIQGLPKNWYAPFR
ncbi:hypothetical protein [Streptomyces albiaxialis]